MGHLNEFLAALSPRERLGLVIAAALVVASAAYVFLVEPLHLRQAQLAAQLEQQRELQIWLTARSKEALRYRSAMRAPAVQASATISEVEESIAANSLRPALARLEPTAGGLSIEFKDADLASVLRWIETTETRLGYAPAEIDIRRTEVPGLADVAMTLVGTAQ